MTAEEYLGQARFIDNRIRFMKSKLEEARERSRSPTSPGFGERCDPNRPYEAPFVRNLEKAWDLEGEAERKLRELYALREQIGAVIGAVDEASERLVLEYRYLWCMTWDQIGTQIDADPKTARRRHDKAIEHVIVPKDAIRI